MDHNIIDYDIIDEANDQHLSFQTLVSSFVNQQYSMGQSLTKEKIKQFYKETYDIRYRELQLNELLNKEPTEFLNE